jgi:hypothetical protein
MIRSSMLRTSIASGGAALLFLLSAGCSDHLSRHEKGALLGGALGAAGGYVGSDYLTERDHHHHHDD